MTVKIALLGVGNMGRNHLRVLSILKDVEVTCIFDFNEAELKSLSKEYSVPYTMDARKAISGVDAVVIVTPTNTHFDYFNLCVGKVKNIFIEKPLATTLEKALEIKALAKQHGTFVQCGFIERFNPVVVELKNVVDHEKVINADFTRTNRLSSRITDVDVVLDLMIHDIDLALYLNGPVKSVVAHGTKENKLVAFSSALLCHENGSLSRILASRMTEKKIRSIHVTTDNSYIDAELVRKELVVHRQSTATQEVGKPYMVSSLEQQLVVKPQEALLMEHQSFIAACQGRVSEDLPGIESGVESLRISELILEQIHNA
ncbi:Gfo/Idh/MocA family protein [Aestuariirhabdus haliotis]|uniref:Gfo/Idh/MocA family protein n=1 Tax=Aestuariirhabdus haliotis TaxID=2918751 RepID=UPI0020C0089B|nr:Gfo/Idh/MocA family oxidoreductase [Aestuariirhabdus haliotis]MCL6419714.1 Gfo/Idh/MocA family oxidoreductase [Aestuariirhabdus haliotis]